jgi:hypothetical protein
MIRAWDELLSSRFSFVSYLLAIYSFDFAVTRILYISRRISYTIVAVLYVCYPKPSLRDEKAREREEVSGCGL